MSWGELTAKMAMKNGDFSVTNMVILPQKKCDVMVETWEKMRCNGGNMGDTSVKVTNVLWNMDHFKNYMFFDNI